MSLNATLSTNYNSPNGLYDPVQKRISTEPFIKVTYGNKVLTWLKKETREAKELRRGTPDEAFSEDLTKTMRNILLKRFPDSGFDVEKPFNKSAKEAFRSCIGFYIENGSNEKVEPETKIQRQRQKGDDFFLMLERGVFRNPEFRKIFKSPFTVYAWLWSNLVRKGWKDKKGYPIKEKYYDRGLLAYCSSYSKIARECFLDKDTVKKYVDHLEAHGIIKIDFIVPEGKKIQQGVYILGKTGEIDGEIKERLYLDEVLLSPKKGSIWDF